MTGLERDLLDEQEGERYTELYALEEERQRNEYLIEFGPDFYKKYPFKPHRVHEIVTARMREESEE